MTASLIAGVDVGGTFTDVVLFDAREQTLRVTKVPSTPKNQADGVRNGLQGLTRDLAGLDKLVHGTTVSTNTMLQASGRTSCRTSSAASAGCGRSPGCRGSRG